MPFTPIDAHFKACTLCGQRATLDAPEPIVHHCIARGLGDVVARLAAAAGIEPCRGCRDRQDFLNRLWPSAAAADQARAEQRLAVCGRCDQLVGERCTMSDQPVLPLAGDPRGGCPARRWPGEVRDYTAAVPLPPLDLPQRWLLVFDHGLGDHVQLTGVLAVLRRLRPHLTLDVQCRAGCGPLFRNIAAETFTLGHSIDPGRYQRIVRLAWAENRESFADGPSTKASSCLRRVFGLAVEPRPQIHLSWSQRCRVAAWMTRQRLIGRAVLLHYKGRCGPVLKNLTDDEAAAAVATIRAAKRVPLVLDWDGNTRLPGVVNAAEACPDAALIAALAEQCELTIGIDSGPGKVFELSAPRSITVWQQMHPINYSEPQAATLHLVPWNHGTFIRAARGPAESYFARHYRHRTYGQPGSNPRPHLVDVLCQAIRDRLRESTTADVWSA